jgi:protein phosphatase
MPAIHSFHRSDRGQKRANNEDAVGAFEPKDARQLRQSGRLYVVADGLGGHQLGEQASRLVVDSLLKVYYEAPEIPPEKRLRDIIQQVHQRLIAARRNMASGDKMATTVVAAVVRNDTLQVAHVGDSRAYLLREGELHQITRDHSFVGEMVRAGAITEREAMQSPYRNRLTRSIGGSDGALEVDVTPPIRLRPGDLILLCTDGLTQYATTEDLLAAASYGTPRQIVERLIRFANARGGADNITVLVVQYGKESALPAVLSWKALAAVGAGVSLLVALAFLGWYVLVWQPAFRIPTVTPTASPTLTAAPTASPTLTALPPTQTPASTQTATPGSTASATPALSETPAPPPSANLVDCQYTVQVGDTAGQIAQKFQATLEQIFRGEERLQNPSHIEVGWILTIKGISENTCHVGGGIPK